MVPNEIRNLRKMNYLPMDIPEDFNDVKLTLLEQKYGIVATGVYLKVLGLISCSKHKQFNFNQLKMLDIFKETPEDKLKEIVSQLFLYDQKNGIIKSEKVEEILKTIKNRDKSGSKVKKIKITAL